MSQNELSVWEREEERSEWDNERMCERPSVCEHSSRLMQYSASPQPNHEDDDAVSHPRSCREPLGVQKANIIRDIFQYFFRTNQPLARTTYKPHLITHNSCFHFKQIL